MSTAICRDRLENMHRACVRDLLNALTCYNNDYQRTNIELKILQEQFRRELDNVNCHCYEKEKRVNASNERLNEFQKNVKQIDSTKEFFNKSIEDLKNSSCTIVNEAKKCLQQLYVEIRQLQQFHNNTVDYLKRRAVQTNDKEVVRNCEKDINKINKLFVNDIDYIKKCESVLAPFLQVLQDYKSPQLSKYGSFKEFEWMPIGKSMQEVDIIADNIKCSMGTVLTKLFAMIHIHQPADVKSFAAAYLLNLTRSEDIVKQKLELIEFRK